MPTIKITGFKDILGLFEFEVVPNISGAVAFDSTFLLCTQLSFEKGSVEGLRGLLGDKFMAVLRQGCHAAWVKSGKPPRRLLKAVNPVL